MRIWQLRRVCIRELRCWIHSETFFIVVLENGHSSILFLTRSLSKICATSSKKGKIVHIFVQLPIVELRLLLLLELMVIFNTENLDHTSTPFERFHQLRFWTNDNVLCKSFYALNSTIASSSIIHHIEMSSLSFLVEIQGKVVTCGLLVNVSSINGKAIHYFKFHWSDWT